jgi:hypothetical protein
MIAFPFNAKQLLPLFTLARKRVCWDGIPSIAWRETLWNGSHEAKERTRNFNFNFFYTSAKCMQSGTMAPITYIQNQSKTLMRPITGRKYNIKQLLLVQPKE